MTRRNGDMSSVIDARCSGEACLRNAGWRTGRKSNASAWLRYLDKLGYGSPTPLQRTFVSSTFGLRISEDLKFDSKVSDVVLGTLRQRPFVVVLAVLASQSRYNLPVLNTQDYIPPDVATIEALVERRVFPIGSRIVTAKTRSRKKIGSLYLTDDAELFVFAVRDWIIVSTSLDRLIVRLSVSRPPSRRSDTDIHEILLFRDHDALECVNERLRVCGYEEFDEKWFEDNFH